MGWDHSGAEDFHPAGALAGRTALAAADPAGHVHLRRRLGEGKEGGPEAHRSAGAEELMSEVRQRRLQVDEGDSFIHGEPLDLGKDRGVEASKVSLR